MEKQFKDFCENIRLTSLQEVDAQTKYSGVCKKLHDHYYETQYDGGTKLLFGSYKTKTNVRPLTADQDVDVLFKIPKETYDRYKAYESNGPAALLQEIRNILKEKYSTTETIKAWGKIVLVQFADGCHNVELLPAYEQENKTFIIPNSENGGSWENFDPRGQIDKFCNSNGITDGLTAELCRMFKTWIRNTSSLSYKSYDLQNDVINFLGSNYSNGSTYSEYPYIVKDFFNYWRYRCSEDKKSCVETAYSRSVKAIEYMDDDKLKEASEEWRKIFGNEFPKVYSNPEKKNSNESFSKVSSPWAPFN